MTEEGVSGDGCAGVGRLDLRNLSGLWVTTTLVVAVAAKAAGLLATVMISAAVAVKRKTVAGAVSAAEQSYIDV